MSRSSTFKKEGRFCLKIASIGRIDALGNTLKEVKEMSCNLLISNTMVKTKSIYDHLFSNLILDEGYVLVKIDSQTLIIYFISSISKVHFIDQAIYCIIDCKIWSEYFFIGSFFGIQSCQRGL